MCGVMLGAQEEGGCEGWCRNGVGVAEVACLA